MHSKLFPLIDSLQCLVFGTHESKITFIDAHSGYDALNKLYNEIYTRVDNHGELEADEDVDLPDKRDFENAIEEYVAINMLLFQDSNLSRKTSLFRQFTLSQRNNMREEGAIHWDSIRDRLLRITEPTSLELGWQLETLLEVIQTFNTELKELVREYMVESPPFRDLETLKRSQFDSALVTLGFDRYVVVRIYTLEALKNAFPDDDKPISNILSGDAGGIAPDSTGFLKFKGTINFAHHITALIDTGAQANLISRQWLEGNRIIIPTTGETTTLQYTDGTKSPPLPIIELRWSFGKGKDSSGGKRRTRVQSWRTKFICIDETQGGFTTHSHAHALIGLPFIEKTQLLHGRDGKLLFPEVSSFSRPTADKRNKGPIPIYNTNNGQGVGPVRT